MPDRYSADHIIELMGANWPEMYGQTHKFLVYLNRVRDLGFAQARGIMARLRISPGEFDILASLRRSAPPNVLSPSELQRSVLITSGGLTKLLYQLEARQLVSRSVQRDDRRCKLVHLTVKGRKFIEDAMRDVMEAETRWVERALSRDEREQLIELLGKSARAIEGAGSKLPTPA